MEVSALEGDVPALRFLNLQTRCWQELLLLHLLPCLRAVPVAQIGALTPPCRLGSVVGQSSHHPVPEAGSGLWGSLQPCAVCSLLGPLPGVGLWCGQAPMP